MIVTNEISHFLVVEPIYFIQLLTCWNLLPQRGSRKKNLIFITIVFSLLLIPYNYILFSKGFDAATKSVFFILTIPGFILYFIISKYRDGRLIFSYFFTDSIISIFNFIFFAISIKYFKELTIPFIITRDISMITFGLLFNFLYITKVRKALNTTRVNWNLIALISFVAGVYIYYELIARGSILDRQDEILHICYTLILLAVVFLTLLWTMLKIGEKEKQELELIKKNNALDLIRIQLKQVDSTYKQINETYNKLRYMRHDINKELAILEGLCIEGNISKIKNHISKIIKTIPESKIVKYCSNHMLNSILNHYNQLIEEQEIKAEFSIKIKENKDSLISDICIILANGIENAIEATSKTDDKYINVDLRETENSIIISITNSFNKNNIKIVNDKLITNKKDVENHGLGLKIIENLATSHNGNMIYIIKDETFRLDIWLNIKN
jgi:hypothetical protein